MHSIEMNVSLQRTYHVVFFWIPARNGHKALTMSVFIGLLERNGPKGLPSITVLQETAL